MHESWQQEESRAASGGKAGPTNSAGQSVPVTETAATPLPPASLTPEERAVRLFRTLPLDPEVIGRMAAHLTAAFAPPADHQADAKLMTALFSGEVHERRLAAWSCFALAARPECVPSPYRTALAVSVLDRSDVTTRLVSLLALVRLGEPADTERAKLAPLAEMEQQPLLRQLVGAYLAPERAGTGSRWYQGVLRVAVYMMDLRSTEFYFSPASSLRLPDERREQLSEAVKLVEPARRLPTGMGTSELLDVLNTILTRGPSVYRPEALMLADQLGAPAAVLAPAFVGLLRSRDPHQSVTAARLLYRNREVPAVQAVFGDVMALLSDRASLEAAPSDLFVSLLMLTVAVGGSRQPGIADAYGAVVRFAHEPSALYALTLLERFDRAATVPAVAHLIEVLRSDESSDALLIRTATTLGALGRFARDARPALMALAAQSAGEVAASAERAAELIEADEGSVH